MFMSDKPIAIPSLAAARCEPGTCEVAILIVPGFSYLSLGCLLEPLEYLRRTNQPAQIGISLFPAGDLTAGQPELGLVCRNSLADLQARIDACPKLDAIFICCGMDVPLSVREPLRRTLRQSRRAGVPIFGIGAATWTLAEVDLLPEGKGVVHWASIAAFRECNRTFRPLQQLFASGSRVSSCAGELATLDLIVHFVRHRFGRVVADQMCEHFLISRPRGQETAQPGYHSSSLRDVPDLLRKIAGRMSQSLEEPIRIAALAREAGISQRQIERLFSRYLNCSPRRYYLELQLAHARQLCEQTDLPLWEIAIASGFDSGASLSRTFKKHYAITPRKLRSGDCRTGASVA